MPFRADDSFKYLIDINVNFTLSEGIFKIDHFIDRNIIEAKQWCSENCYSKWMIAGECFAFVNKVDAIRFKLTWG